MCFNCELTTPFSLYVVHDLYGESTVATPRTYPFWANEKPNLSLKHKRWHFENAFSALEVLRFFTSKALGDGGEEEGRKIKEEVEKYN